MKIYFEIGPLRSLTQFMNMEVPRVISNINGYASMIKDASTSLKNHWDIYTNELSLLGAGEIFGNRFMHQIMIRNENDEWVQVNSHLIRKLETPINIEQYFRRNICSRKQN